MARNQSFGGSARGYNATLLICLFGSTGFCFAFLPIIPLRVQGKHSASEIALIFRIVCTEAFAFAAFALSLYLLHHRKKLHGEGRVLWPMRCQHCARLTGLLPKYSTFTAAHYVSRFSTLQRPGPSPSSSAIPSSPHGPNLMSAPNAPHAPESDEHSSYGSSQGESFFPRRSAYASSTHIRRYDAINSEGSLVEQSIFSANRSVVNLFNVFGLWAIVGIFCVITGRFACENSSVLLLVSGEFVDFARLLLVPVAMLFFANYHDAVFAATTTTCVMVASFVSGGLWMYCVQVILPLQPLINISDEQPCLLNGTIRTLYDFGKSTMTPVYTEGTIIAIALYLQMWNALIPKSALKLDGTDPHQHQEWQEASILSQLRAVIKTCRSCFNHMLLPGEMLTPDESQWLLTLSSHEILTHVYRAWTITLFLGISYFTMTIIFFAMPSILPSLNTDIVIWSIEIAFLIPLLLLLVKESNTYRNTLTLTVVSRGFPERKFKGHDVLLLLCTCGIFSHNFFRSSAAVGFLVRGDSLSNNDIMLSVSAIVYSFVITIVIWLTTAFLLNIQRYSRANLRRTKWNLSCLIYIIVINGMEWAICSFTEEHWVIQIKFFGKTTGQVIGVLLEPFSSLYQLHSAMIAYEIYKGIMRDNR